MSDQMDMFHERKIAHMPTSTIGKAVENMIVLLGGVFERTPTKAHTRDCIARAIFELNTYLGREDITRWKGA
jgi:hypothetical protein